MKSFKEFIGRTSSERSHRIDQATHARFAEAVRSPNGHCPTIWTRCREGEFELLQAIGLSLTEILHGEQEYDFHEDCAPGVSYRYRTALKNVLEKQARSARLHVLLFETEIFQATDGRRCATARSTIIHREKVAPQGEAE